GNNAVQVMQVNAGAGLKLENITIENGLSAFGGGINNLGTLNIINTTFSGNTANVSGGGAINNNIGSILNITNSIFSGNSTGSNGGGINNSGGTFIIKNSTFSGNSAVAGGGGILGVAQ